MISACVCGQRLAGLRSTRRYCSPACRLQAHRGCAPSVVSQTPEQGEKPPQRSGAVSHPTQARVETLTDTIRPVHCSGCAVLMPRLEGPLPPGVPAFCRECVAAGLCEVRPAGRGRAR